MLCLHDQVVLGQPTGLCGEVCLHAGADWLKHISQPEGGERSVSFQEVSKTGYANQENQERPL